MPDIRKEIIKVAYYKSIGMSLSQIAKKLDTSEITVRRRLKDAQNRYLKESIVLDISESELADVYPEILDHEQMERFEKFFGTKNVRVIIAPEIPKNITGQVNTLKWLGKIAAIHISSILKEGYTVGVSFGRTIKEVSLAARELFYNPKNNRKIRFIPLIGGLSVLNLKPSELYSLAFQCSASQLAADLSETFNGSTEGQIYLPIPAFVPKKYLEKGDIEDRVKIARELIESITEFSMIFVDNDSELNIKKMDMILTSVGGPPGQGWLERGGPTINDEENKALIEAGVCGDICGHFITRKAEEFDLDHIISRISQRIFSPTPKDFQMCVQRSRDKKPSTPGVIIIANGREKAEAILGCIERECVSTIIIDKELANEIEKLEPDIQ